MSRVWWMCALTASIGCASGDSGDSGDSDEPEDTDTTEDGCLADPMTVSPGTGDLAYVPLGNGDPVTIFHGPQGGWHIETAGYVEHTVQSLSLHPKVTAVALGLGLAGTEEPVAGTPPEPGDIGEFKALAFYSDAECHGEFWGVRAFVDDVVTPPGGLTYQEFICSLEGEELSLTIDVEDLDSGRTATATVNVIAQLDPVVDAPVCP